MRNDSSARPKWLIRSEGVALSGLTWPECGSRSPDVGGFYTSPHTEDLDMSDAALEQP